MPSLRFQTAFERFARGVEVPARQLGVEVGLRLVEADERRADLRLDRAACRVSKETKAPTLSPSAWLLSGRASTPW